MAHVLFPSATIYSAVEWGLW